MSHEAAETLALSALAFLAEEPARFARFLALTGVEPQHIRSLAADSGFLCAVLDFLAEHEPLLIAFAAQNAMEPKTIACARDILGVPAWERETA